MKVPSTWSGVSQIAKAFREQSAEWCAPRREFCCELLLREALANAVKHGGNGREKAGELVCIVRPKPGRVLIWVQDQGPGFDWRRIYHRESDPEQPGGRGMEIYRKYATRVRFNSSGNGVALLKRWEEASN